MISKDTIWKAATANLFADKRAWGIQGFAFYFTAENRVRAEGCLMPVALDSQTVNMQYEAANDATA